MSTAGWVVALEVVVAFGVKFCVVAGMVTTVVLSAYIPLIRIPHVFLTITWRFP